MYTSSHGLHSLHIQACIAHHTGCLNPEMVGLGFQLVSRGHSHLADVAVNPGAHVDPLLRTREVRVSEVARAPARFAQLAVRSQADATLLRIYLAHACVCTLLEWVGEWRGVKACGRRQRRCVVFGLEHTHIHRTPCSLAVPPSKKRRTVV